MDEIKSKHIDLIQSNISRMSNNSFLLKGWAVTILAAIFVLSAKESNETFAFIAAIPVIGFWLLDSYFLQNERKYRILYNIVVRNKPDETLSLTMPCSNRAEKTTYLQALFSKIEILFYSLLVAVIVASFFVIKYL